MRAFANSLRKLLKVSPQWAVSLNAAAYENHLKIFLKIKDAQFLPHTYLNHSL